MKNRMSMLLALATALFALPSLAENRGVLGDSRSPHTKLHCLDIDESRWTDGFWAERWEINRKVTQPVIWKALNDPTNGATFLNFLIHAGERAGEPARTAWSDGDVYKYLEGIAYVYAQAKDESLSRHMDEMIAAFAKCQDADGYISTPIKLKGLKRWDEIRNHELYNMGHLLTAAAIHYRITGKTNFLEIARKLGDHLHEVFGPRPAALAHFGFNPSNIMGAVELYRTTGDRKYLDLAGTFVDMRGSAKGGADHNQDGRPLRQETEAVGHAVTANYLYAGAADVFAETGDRALLEALERIWENATSRKMYVTGAVGNLHRGDARDRKPTHEAYGQEYELPLRLGYNETCASIGNAMWNWRMLGLTGDARYGDVMERVLYNSMLSGVSVAGDAFAYINPLRRHADELPLVMRPQDGCLRRATMVCYCCPPNVARAIANLHNWAYSKSESALWVNLYGGSQVETGIAGGKLRLRQATGYPWRGDVEFTVEAAPERAFALMLRIPEWAEGATVTVNGEAAPSAAAPASYTELRRVWKAGDTVRLRLPMEPRLVLAHPYVEDARNQVAVMRGPVVYALESPDVPAGVRLSEVAIRPAAPMRARHDPGLLGGVTVIETTATVIPAGGEAGRLYQTLRPFSSRSVPVKLIPYYAWGNRGLSHMSVWLPVDW